MLVLPIDELAASSLLRNKKMKQKRTLEKHGTWLSLQDLGSL